eukprot:CAMPEP_0170542346 /NCGR_PEP_ID=MMETSP0211-20121228/1803_1 /TAXON_ID=311385 /ORGANISM="Pseudokeronopsis sp., Strain OXSARD2" /LENGTH=57 /DNA_ID=CAMNT_0010845375 /DNA_START=1952 /DNA_END=2125 /DNA_ORIENTATION=+
MSCQLIEKLQEEVEHFKMEGAEAFRRLDVANTKYGDLLDILNKKMEKGSKADFTRTV